jgi:beta-lactamase regulating signal transducer with metallopeptidase domain
VIGSLPVDPEPYMHGVVTILMHSLWQGILIGLFTAIVLSLMRSSTARSRYVVSCCAMLAVIVAAAVTAAAVWPDNHVATGNVSPAIDELIGRARSSDVGATSSPHAFSMDVPTLSRWRQQPSISRNVFVIWLVGVILFSGYHLAGWLRARRLVKQGTSPVPPEWRVRFDKLQKELDLRKLATLLLSSLVRAPCVVGWIKPVILVPASMFTSLSPSEIEMILVHELAHVRRYDVLINLMQSTMETLFFFNPAIWWISRQIRMEREDCCDDTVILRAGSRIRYARALTNLEEATMFRTNIGAAIGGAPLRNRIQRIVGVPRARSYSAMLSLAGMLLPAFFILIVLGPLGTSNDSALQACESTLSAQAFEPKPGDLHGEWETEMDGDQLKILVYGRESSGMSYILTPDDVTGLVGQAQRPVRIVRDAGTLFLDGRLKVHNGKATGSGEWHFRPDTAYMQFMGRYGLGQNDRQKTFSLAIFDISRKYLAEMEERGYRDLNVDQLVSAGVFDISPEFVDELREAGYHDLPYNRLLSMRVQGVTSHDARAFERLGCGHLTADQLISARIHGITPEFVRGFRRAGFRDLSYNSFVTLRAFNIDVREFKNCYRHRFMDLSQDNMVWVCGFHITREDIERMKERGYTDIDTAIKAICREKGK